MTNDSKFSMLKKLLKCLNQYRDVWMIEFIYIHETYLIFFKSKITYFPGHFAKLKFEVLVNVHLNRYARLHCRFSRWDRFCINMCVQSSLPSLSLSPLSVTCLSFASVVSLCVSSCELPRARDTSQSVCVCMQCVYNLWKVLTLPHGWRIPCGGDPIRKNRNALEPFRFGVWMVFHVLVRISVVLVLYYKNQESVCVNVSIAAAVAEVRCFK